MDEYEQKALDDIEKHGCHVLHVMEEDNYPRFTYSIGIEKNNKQTRFNNHWFKKGTCSLDDKRILPKNN